MRTHLGVAFLTALAGCSTLSADPRKSANVTGNEVSVTVNNVWNANQAFPLADEHCHKYSKAARQVPGSNGNAYAFTFDCVTP